MNDLSERAGRVPAVATVSVTFQKGQHTMVAAAIRTAERPLIICGGGVHYSGAEAELQQALREQGTTLTLDLAEPVPPLLPETEDEVRQLATSQIPAMPGSGQLEW